MRIVSVAKVRKAVEELCLKANFELRKDILGALRLALKREKSSRAKGILWSIIENARIAKSKKI
ncbi:MAG: fumarate hydratase, partial [Candidatus Dadabacteria bacterium]|nr:fumarate hydratase [Candidatus Dadabacteria bacterium]